MVTQPQVAAMHDGKRSYWFRKRDGVRIRCRVPAHYTVAAVKSVLVAAAGYELFNGEGMSVRLVVETDSSRQLLADETRFRDIEEGLTLRVIPSLSPASG
jgi:hypothetical protein